MSMNYTKSVENMCVYANCTRAVHINRICMCALYTNHNAHSSRITTMCACVHMKCMFMLLTFHAYVCGVCHKNFQNASSCVVDEHVHGELLIELYRR